LKLRGAFVSSCRCPYFTFPPPPFLSAPPPPPPNKKFCIKPWVSKGMGLGNLQMLLSVNFAPFHLKCATQVVLGVVIQEIWFWLSIQTDIMHLNGVWFSKGGGRLSPGLIRDFLWLQYTKCTTHPTYHSTLKISRVELCIELCYAIIPTLLLCFLLICYPYFITFLISFLVNNTYVRDITYCKGQSSWREEWQQKHSNFTTKATPDVLLPVSKYWYEDQRSYALCFKK